MSNIPSVFMPADDCSSFKKRVSNLTKKMVVTVEAKLLLSVYDCSDIYGSISKRIPSRQAIALAHTMSAEIPKAYCTV